ncbi:MAG: M48 family metalloprotease [Terriglobales bacterium]
MKERAVSLCATSGIEVFTKAQNLHLRNLTRWGGHKPPKAIAPDELRLESRSVNSKMPCGEMVPFVLRMPSRRSGSFLRILLLAFAIVALSDCPASSQGWFQDFPPATSASSGQAASVPQDSIAFDRVVDEVIQTEKEFLQTIRNFTPLVETYIQNLKPDLELGTVPVSDQYFLGKLDLSRGLSERSFLQQPRLAGWLEKLTSIYSLKYMPLGFAQMIFVDESGFDRQHYSFSFVRREFVGEVRCLVIDVAPLPSSGNSRFLGRIWVEDEGYHIVRFNGTFTPHPHYTYKLDFDSWRLNPLPGLWLPAYIYSQQSDEHYRFGRRLRFKAQTRLWGYDLQHAGDHQEFTQIMIDEPFFDHSGSGQDLSPLLSLRQVQYSAEENVVERLQVAGLMAPKGDVDKVLQTVVQNLEIANDLIDKLPDVRCRILLTTPLESFAIGHTIVISRGLIDVLPDEATLAAVLAHELAHIVLGHSLNLDYSFNERMFFPDEQSLRRLTFHRDSREEVAADQKAMEMLANSPYKDRLKNAGLFFEALEARAPALPNLIRARLGNALIAGKVSSLAALKPSAPQLAMRDTGQVAALPLGGRIKLDPWSDCVELIDIKPVPLLNAGEKMPFEVTPFYPYLKRIPTPNGSLHAKTDSPADRAR